MRFFRPWCLLSLLSAAKAAQDEAPRPERFLVHKATPKWKTFGGLNCWHIGNVSDGLESDVVRYGASEEDVSELAEMTLDECKEKCVEDTSCEGILTIHRHVEPDQPPEGPCWLRRDLTSVRCVTDTPWDLHVLDSRVAFSRSDASEGGQDIFDCNAGLERWEREWTHRKKEYCCQATGLRCMAGSPPTYDCTAPEDERVDWSADQQACCCETNGVACGAAEYDCNEGRRNWEAGWSNKKKDYCCSTDVVSFASVRPKSYHTLFDESHRLMLILLVVLVSACFICLGWLVLVLAGCCTVDDRPETENLVGGPPVRGARRVAFADEVSTLVEQRIPVQVERDVQVSTLVEQRIPVQVEKDVQVSIEHVEKDVQVVPPPIVQAEKDGQVSTLVERRIPVQVDKDVQVSTLVERQIPVQVEKHVQVSTVQVEKNVQASTVHVDKDVQVAPPRIVQAEKDVQVSTLVERQIPVQVDKDVQATPPPIVQADKDVQVSTLVEQRIPLQFEKDVQVSPPPILQTDKDVQVSTIVEQRIPLQLEKDVQVSTLKDRPAILQVEKDVQVATLQERPATMQVEKHVQVASVLTADKDTQVSIVTEYAQVVTLVEQPTIVQGARYTPLPQQVVEVVQQPTIVQGVRYAPVPRQVMEQPTIVPVERSYPAGDQVLGVRAPGYGPINVTLFDRATSDPFRNSEYDNSWTSRSFLDQMLAARRF